VFVCALNASYDYDVHVPSGANYSNVTVPNEFILEDRATPETIEFKKMTLTSRDSSGNIVEGERIAVYEENTYYLACIGYSNSIGKMYCGLDKNKNYDVMMFNISIPGFGITNVTTQEGVEADENVTVAPVTQTILVSPPTIVTLQGKLTDTSDTTVDVGSMRIKIYEDESGDLAWNSTFNDVLDSGVFNIGLGTLNAMYLTRDLKYKVEIDVDIDSATYSTADITFGDSAPSGDLIKFVPG